MNDNGPPPAYEKCEVEENLTTATQPQNESIIIFKNLNFLHEKHCQYIIVDSILLMLGWVLMKVLANSDGAMAASDGESLAYMIICAIPWCFNVLYLLLKLLGYGKRFKGGNVNVQLMMFSSCVVSGILILFVIIWGKFHAESQMNEYRGFCWLPMVIGFITSIMLAIQAFIHYKLNANENCAPAASSA